jgi:hypothetical protein
METHKTENCKQYRLGGIALCVTTAKWRKKRVIDMKEPVLFIGGAYDVVSPKFAAAILKQFRRESPRQGGAK